MTQSHPEHERPGSTAAKTSGGDRRRERRERWSVLVRVYRHLGPHIRYVLPAGVFSLVILAVQLFVPQFSRSIIDRAVRPSDLQLLGVLVLGLLAVSIVKGVLTFLQGRLTELASQNVAFDIRNELHGKLTSLSFSFHDNAESGQLLSRTYQDVEQLRFMTGRAGLRIIEGATLLVGTMVMMVAMDPLLSVFALVAVVLLAHRAFRFGSIIRPLSTRMQEQLAKLTSRLEQSLRGIKVVKSYAREDAEVERFGKENDAWFALAARAARVRSVNGPALGFIADLARVAVVLVGGLLIMGQRLTYGELIAFTGYLAQLAFPIRAMGFVAPAIGMGMAAGERVFSVLDHESEVRDDPGATDVSIERGSIDFDNVSFAYTDGTEVLRGFSLAIAPGETVALLGGTGSGKTTVMNLIPRFYDATGGEVRVDGVSIRSMTLASLRSAIAIVQQESVLFTETIRANIAFGRPDATDEDVEAAARAARIHDFIVTLPKGYQTKVGETGRTLSGGQKQRLAIARAILTDPKILLLDDATSSVDVETERLIQEAFQRLMQGRTSVVIAQRLSTLRLADRVVVMERGQIEAVGTHAELYATNPRYRVICDHQAGGLGAEAVRLEEEE